MSNTNEKIQELIKDINIIKLSQKATSRFSTLSKSEKQTCVLNAIWKAISKYDESFGVKFTTFLYKGIVFECLTQAKFANANRQFAQINNNMQDRYNYHDNLDLLDELENDTNSEILKDKFVRGLSIKEIAKKDKVCVENIRRKINKSCKKIKQKIF